MKTNICIVVLEGTLQTIFLALKMPLKRNLGDIHCDVNKLEILIFIWLLKRLSFASLYRKRSSDQGNYLCGTNKNLNRRNMFKQAFCSDLISTVFFVRIVC